VWLDDVSLSSVSRLFCSSHHLQGRLGETTSAVVDRMINPRNGGTAVASRTKHSPQNKHDIHAAARIDQCVGVVGIGVQVPDHRSVGESRSPDRELNH